ncbi:dihydrolipoyl dehydrogenase [Candidatus Pantoea carbekii]|uniref:Dihydrolipoyl dehydrogenase n=1 Tax=Candidatus Pantoea carbekii TaxID=1235990 RepID=U3U9E4_9GAMM|nr:dihydrolipoyl dehydrogenase [Candidatus Pantoea carbekii]AKC31916.1 dihydrolipoyl dehydrogenase LpdA [Candidatus Pantoea carbekii]BAO00433.1 LpdA protein [Candidatus Pantoea carbekii]
MNKEIYTQVLVLGSGPAGYSAAFRCADLGLKTVIVERYSTLGGVCLNVGCIPSKALLHVAKIIDDSSSLKENGVIFSQPIIDISKINIWKNKVIKQLTSGLVNMAKNRHIQILQGIGKFSSSHSVIVQHEANFTQINFDNVIIATGSYPVKLPLAIHEDPRIWDSTAALRLEKIPKRLLIIGGGIIGLEIGNIYHALGSKIDIVEICNQLISGADQDIATVFMKSINKKFNLMLETKLVNVNLKQEGVYVELQDKTNIIKTNVYDVILVAIGRVPNTKELALDKAGVKLDKNAFICVDKQMRTNVQHIYAIGDIVGQPMLAHKAIHQGHIAAEVISGLKHYFDPKVIPSIAYTDPEVAWVGLTEQIAQEKKIGYETAHFKWTASGRAIASNCSNGITKLIFNKDNHRIIGGAVVGSNGGELLGEIGLAIEMGCDAEDIALIIHAHPTLNESIGLAAQIFQGSITDVLNPKAKK